MHSRLMTVIPHTLLLLLLFGSCRETAKEAPAAAVDPMKEGLEALHTRRDPATAVTHFRKVLEQNPSHYGANYQIAAALEASGKRDEARPYWQKVLKMAEEIGDQATAVTARNRLAPQAVADKHVLWMQSGLNLLYDLNRPADAALEFQKILSENPDHYGANYQLATALDRSDRRDEATPLWERVLRMAEGYKDEQTANTARARLAQR